MRATMLLAALLAATPAAATDQGERITVRLTSFAFEPSVITLHHGKHYLLHIRNDARGGHNFQAKAFFADAVLAPEERARVAGGKLELDGGEAADLALTAPATPATYPLKCTHFLHSAFGMTGKIVVD